MSSYVVYTSTCNFSPFQITKSPVLESTKKFTGPVIAGVKICISVPICYNSLNASRVQELKTISVIMGVDQFYSWFNFDFLLFFSILIYDNEYQTKKNQN